MRSAGIAAFVKAQEDVTKPQLRSCLPNFDLKKYCFLCGEEVPSNYAEKQRKKSTLQT